MEIYSKKLLVPSALPPTTGAKRVALHSMFRIICEANQLLVADVVGELNAPLYGPSPDRHRKLVKSVHLIDAGSVHSVRMVMFLESLTGLENLGSLTLADLSGLNGVASLWTRPYRRWCPHCYTEDIASGLPAYDRLLWSIDLVRHCPSHQTLLRSACRRCGGDRAPHLFGRDISGFCPRCRAWLGEHMVDQPQIEDDQIKHLRWIARSFADLLDTPPPREADLLPNIQSVVRRLADLHHLGITSHLARQIRRNKSVVSTWLGGHSQPAWHALCDISYVYQQPLPALLLGDVADITVADPLPLPVSSRPRQGQRRKCPFKRDVAEVVRVLGDVVAGKHPGITTIRKVAHRLNMDAREIYRVAGCAAKETAAVLAERNAAARAKAAIDKLTEREVLIQRVARTLTERQSKVTRRIVHEEMAKLGMVVRWSDSRAVLGTVRALVAAQQVCSAVTGRVSGTS